MGKGLACPSGKHVVLTLVENQPGSRDWASCLVGHWGPGQRGQGWRCHSACASARACHSLAPCQLASPRNTRCFCSRRPRKQLDWETAPRFNEPVTRGSEDWVSRSPRCFWGGVTLRRWGRKQPGHLRSLFCLQWRSEWAESYIKATPQCPWSAE